MSNGVLFTILLLIDVLLCRGSGVEDLILLVLKLYVPVKLVLGRSAIIPPVLVGDDIFFILLLVIIVITVVFLDII